MISKIRIKNFKAIKDSGEISLSPFTAIIGRNGSGKSSLIEAIEFLYDFVTKDLEHALNRWKSYQYIRYNGNRENFDVTVDTETMPMDMLYSREPSLNYGFESGEDSVPENQDDMDIEYQLEGISFNFEFKNNTITDYFCIIAPYTNDRIIFAVEKCREALEPVEYFRDNKDKNNEKLIEWFPSSHVAEREGIKVFKENLTLYKSILNSNTLKAFHLNLEKIQILNLNAFLIGDPVLKYFAREDKKLLKDGSNLLSFLFWIQKYRLENFNNLKKDFFEIINYSKDFDEQITSDIQSQVYFQLTELRDGEVIVKTPSWLMSTGSQKVLSLLSIIHNPEPSPLIIIEEFENGLDPWTISYLIKKFKELTGSQVIITTHSPTLLNLIENYDEILFAKRDNETGTLEYVRFDEEKKMFDDVRENILPGELYEKIKKEDEEKLLLINEIEKIKSHFKENIKCLVITEDSEYIEDSKKMPLSMILKASGFSINETLIQSYYGKDKIMLGYGLAQSAEAYPNIKKVIIHRDRDGDVAKKKIDFEKFKNKHKLNKAELFVTRFNDIEGYFINKEHIQALYNNISDEQANEIISSSLLNFKDKSIDKLTANLGNNRDAAIALYETNPLVYTYTKQIKKEIHSKLSKLIPGKHTIFMESSFLKDLELEKIAKEIWG